MSYSNEMYEGNLSIKLNIPFWSRLKDLVGCGAALYHHRPAK